ncbi:MAG: class I adenylate-forming enzyme family protein [Gammaproteobacteria bacterium]|nr:class I adenylate-forming enzyme family protein [Gammaproteobacteria bacterium]
MFVCGGENVYPGQVERILEKDERIHEVCVVARPDEVKGQLPIAFIVKAPQVTISEDDVKQLALEKAPAYMHPREVVFIESMPLAGTNKIDRKVLELRATDRKYKGDIQCVAAILGQQQSVYVIGCES